MTAASDRCSSRITASGALDFGRGQVALDGGHEHGNRRVLQKLLRLGSEHQPLDPAAAVRSNEDQVAAARFGGAEDRLVAAGRSS